MAPLPTGDGSRLVVQDRSGLWGWAARAEGAKPTPRTFLAGPRMEMSVALDSAEHVESVSDVMLEHRLKAGLGRGLAARSGTARESEALESVVGGVGGRIPCMGRGFRLGFLTRVRLAPSSTGFRLGFFTTVQAEPSSAGPLGLIWVPSHSGADAGLPPGSSPSCFADTSLWSSAAPDDEGGGVALPAASAASSCSGVGAAQGDGSWQGSGKTAGCAFAFAGPTSERLDRFCFDFLPGFGAGCASFSKLASKASCKA